MHTQFTIPGAPQGKARARTTRFGTYTPDKTVLYENLIKTCYKQETDFYSEKPLAITIVARFEIPKSTSKKRKQMMLDGEIKPSKKPDIDNIAKVILDALNGIAYKDDTQVISLAILKTYSNVPDVDVGITEVGD